MLPVQTTLNKLYIRIWLAVVLAVAVLTLLVGWAWRMAADPPLREVVVRNQAGDVIGSGYARMRRFGNPTAPPTATEGERSAAQSQEQTNALGSDHADADGLHRVPDEAVSFSRGKVGEGPEFLVRMQDGQTIHMHLPRP